MRNRFLRLVRIVSLAAVIAFPLTATAPAGAATSDEISPNPTNMVDCNGYSSVYHSLKVTMRSLCTDPYFKEAGGAERAYDNGKYTLDDDGSRVHLHDTMTYQLDANILQFLGLFDDWEPLVARLERPPSLPEQRQTDDGADEQEHRAEADGEHRASADVLQQFRQDGQAEHHRRQE